MFLLLVFWKSLNVDNFHSMTPYGVLISRPEDSGGYEKSRKKEREKERKKKRKRERKKEREIMPSLMATSLSWHTHSAQTKSFYFFAPDPKK